MKKEKACEQTECDFTTLNVHEQYFGICNLIPWIYEIVLNGTKGHLSACASFSNLIHDTNTHT